MSIEDESPPLKDDVKDFKFKQLAKIQVATDDFDSASKRTGLLAAANKYGLVFVGYASGFKVIKSENVLAIGQCKNTVADFDFWADIKTETTPTHLAVSFDALTLVVVIEKSGTVIGVVYDVRGFSTKGASVDPFLEIRLSATPGVSVTDIAWNPGMPTLLVTALSDGCLTLWDIKDNLTIVNKVPTAKATCVCWTRKGKQLVTGKSDGTLQTYDTTLTPKFPLDPKYHPGHKVTDIVWVSATVFVCAFSPAVEDVTYKPQIVTISTFKDGSFKCVWFDDICYGGDEARVAHYYFSFINEWDIVVANSSKSLEAAVLGKDKNDKTKWEIWSLDDSARAELPLTDDDQERYPIGVAIDTTSQSEIILGENLTHPASPILYLLSTDGLLCCYHVMYENAQSINVKAEPIVTSGNIRKGLPSAHPSVTPSQTLSTEPKAKPTVPSFGSIGASSSLSSSTFPAFGSLTTSGAPSFSSLSSSTNSTPSFGAKPTTSLPSFGGSTKPESSAVPKFSFGGNSVPTASSGIAKPGDKDGSAGFAVPNPGSAFSFGTPQASSISSPAQPAIPAAKTQPEIKTEKPTQPAFESTASSKPVPPAFGSPASTGFSFGNKPKEGTSVASVTIPTIPPSSSQQKGLTSLTQPLSGPSSTATTTERPSLPINVPNKPQPAALQPASTVKKSETGQKTSLQANLLSDGSDNPFIKSILEEMAQFENEMSAHISRSKSLKIDIGTKPEMKFLREETEKMKEFCEDIKSTTKEINREIHDLKSDCLETFAMLEDCNARRSRDMDPHYKQLLRSRPLDPGSAKKLERIQQTFHYVENSLNDCNMKLDLEWQAYQAKRRGQTKKIKIPTVDTVYRVMKTNSNIIAEQANAIEQLTGELQHLKIVNKSSPWRYERQRSNDFDLKSVADRSFELNESLTTKSPKPPSSMSPEKTSKLRQVLSRRKVTPVKSSLPSNLSMSKIVSTKSLREALSDSQIDFDETEIKSSLPEDVGADQTLPQPLEKDFAKSAVAYSSTPGRSTISWGSPTLKTPPANKPLPLPIYPGLNDDGTSLPPPLELPKVVSPGSGPPANVLAPGAETMRKTAFKPALPVMKPVVKATTPIKSPGYSPKIEAITPPATPASDASGKMDKVEVPGSGQTAPVKILFGNKATDSSIKPTMPPTGSFVPVQSASIPAFGFGSTPGKKEETKKETKPAFSTLATDAKPAETGSGFKFGAKTSDSVSAFTLTSAAKKPLDLTAQKEEITKPNPTSGFKALSSTLETNPGNIGPSFQAPASSSGFTFGKATFGQAVVSGSSSTTTGDTTSIFGGKTGSAPVSFGNLVTSSSGGITAGKPVVKTESSESTSSSDGELTKKAEDLSKKTEEAQNVEESEKKSSPAKPDTSKATVQASDASTGSTPLFVSNSQAKSIFGLATTASIGAVAFGGSAPSSSSTATSAAAAKSLFGFSTTSTTTAATLATSTAPKTNLFGVPTSSASGDKSPGASPFGLSKTFGPPSSSGFGSGSVFGKINTTTNETSSTETKPTVTEAESSPDCSAAATSSSDTKPQIPEATTVSSTASTQSSLFGNTSSSLFGKPTTSSAPASSAFGSTASTSTTANAQSLFGTPVTTSSAAKSLFGQSVSSSSSSGATSVFGTPAKSSVFGAPATSGASVFGVPAASGTSIFGQTTAPSASSVFGQAAALGSPAPVFGQTSGATPKSVFGQTNSGSVFGQTSSFQQLAKTTTASSVFGGQSSGSGFGSSGAPVFGQSTFGSTSPAVTSSSGGFGSSSPFGQPSQSPSGGGGSGLFGGLGGKPSAENVDKNVFGSPSTFGNSDQTPGLFGSGNSSGFGASSFQSRPTGSFSGGGGNVTAQGFGGFNQTPQKTGGFGSAPSFGSSPAFGSSPGFGSGAAFASPVGGLGTPPSNLFGGGSGGDAQSSGFAAMAQSNSPTFGALAGQSNTGFGASPSFGGFGSPQAQNAPKAPSFTSYRS